MIAAPGTGQEPSAATGSFLEVQAKLFGLHLDHGRLVEPTGQMKTHARKCWRLCGVIRRHRRKHPIDHAHMEMHMRVQAGAEAVDKGDCIDA